MTVPRRALFAQILLAGLANLLVERREARAETVQYTYDNAGRLVRAQYSNGTIITYTYDDAGNRIEARTGGMLAPRCSLFASPASIAFGQPATLTWSSADATSASISPGVGVVSPATAGSISVSPGATTPYTLTTTGPGGQSTAEATVTVGAPPPPFCLLTADPAAIELGTSTTLTWTSKTATSATIDNGVGSVTPVASGSRSASPTADTTYTLTVTGPGGQATADVEVLVSPRFTATIQVTGPDPINLRNLANAAGYNGRQPATIVFVVPSGETITGANVSYPGIDTGTWPSAPFAIDLELQISGGVRGSGGGGGMGSSGFAGGAAGAGGDAIICRTPIDIVINAGSTIQGGGGGGGGGGGWRRQNADGDITTYSGGGGGGGWPSGPRGLAGQGMVQTASDGVAGTPAGGGAGGAGGAASGRMTGAGGSGGGPGQSGQHGQPASGTGGVGTWTIGPTGGGGAAGYAIRKSGFAVSVTNNGTITGTVG